ncbi:coiled-coil domain-containing protein 18-like [Cyprinodon tularosa]|uniref:coiled-coil domain-containing protein 18-like n=1 Tax=Cyprinodon tularosa TaxID=77115 RepID=UPI0018E22C63|nr:coiled-coil domain-containing protein 18-like [Cyprinodon tularosa]
MPHQRQHYHNVGSRYQPYSLETRRNQRSCINNRQPDNPVQDEIKRLNSLLEMEKSKWLEENQKVSTLEEELEKAKSELKRQKNLKEMFINKGKETKRELMRIQKFTDPETLSPATIASKVNNDMKYKKKKMLQVDFEHLKVAHIVQEEAFISQIQTEKEKNAALQQELEKINNSYEELRSKEETENAGANQQVNLQIRYEDKMKQDQKIIESLRAENAVLQTQMEQMKVSYQELSSKYNTDISLLMQKVETYQHDMVCEKNANEKRAKFDRQLINEIAQKEPMAHEFGFLKQISTEMMENLQSELAKVKVLYQELKTRYETDVFALTQQKDAFQQELDKETKAHSEKMRSYCELGAKKDALQKQLINLQQQYSECEVSYKTELEHLKAELHDKEDLGRPKRKKARRQEPRQKEDSIPVKTISDPASMDLETLSEDVIITNVSTMEVDEFIQEMLRDYDILNSESKKKTGCSVETLPEQQESPDAEPTEASCSKNDPSVWKKIRHGLGLKKPEKWKKSNTSQNNN